MSTLGTFLGLPGILLARRRLLHDNDEAWARRLGEQVLEIDGRRLRPKAQGYINFLKRLSVPPSQWAAPSMRASFEASSKTFGGPTPPLPQVHDFHVELPGRSLAARIYEPRPTQGRTQGAGILFLHGGGFVIGSLDTHDRLCRRLALSAGIPVVALDYRLAPEHPLPAAANDAIETWDWLGQSGTRVAFDPNRIAVCGDSAGAALAIAVCDHAAKQRHSHRPRAAAFIYPPYGAAVETKSRSRLANEDVGLTHTLIEWFEHNALIGSDYQLPEASSLALEAFPPSYVVTCQFDPLRDEGQRFCADLLHAGIDVQTLNIPDLVHGFITLAALFPEADSVADTIGQFAATHCLSATLS